MPSGFSDSSVGEPTLCCLNAYAFGNASISFTHDSGDNWIIGFSGTLGGELSTGTLTNITRERKFYAGGVELTSNTSTGLGDHSMGVGSQGAGVHWMRAVYSFDDGAELITTRMVRVDGSGNILNSISVSTPTNLVQPDCFSLSSEVVSVDSNGYNMAIVSYNTNDATITPLASNTTTFTGTLPSVAEQLIVFNLAYNPSHWTALPGGVFVTGSSKLIGNENCPDTEE